STAPVQTSSAQTFKIPSPCAICTSRACKSNTPCPSKRSVLPSLPSTSSSSSPAKHVKLDQWEADLEREIISSWDYQS
ncbi:hypothetical protein JCM8547_003548, partial [Rhodosporidiobolus lusitaniae]